MNDWELKDFNLAKGERKFTDNDEWTPITLIISKDGDVYKGFEIEFDNHELVFKNNNFSHTEIDDGENPVRMKMSRMVIPSTRPFPTGKFLEQFKQWKNLDKFIKEWIVRKVKAY
jgi:hypothetical protein